MGKYFQEEIETASREKIEQIQTDGLLDVVKRVYENVPFYRKKMVEKGVTPDDIKSLKDISKLPFLTKDDLRDAYPYGLLAVPLKNCVRIHSTSGTTGKRVVDFYTKKDIDMWEDGCARALVAAGGTDEDVVHVAYGYGLFTGGFGLNGGSQKVGSLTLPMSSGNTDRQLQFMTDLGSTILCCTPSYASYLAESIEERGIKDQIKLKAGIFGAEAWSEDMRADIENRLGIKAYDIYGLTEIEGPGVAFECEEHAGLHILHDWSTVEVINNEIILTAVKNKAFPFIRYQVGDVSLGEKLITEKCKCGRTLFRLKGISGRNTYFVKDIDGREVSVMLFTYPFDSDYNILQYQVVEENGELIVNFITDKYTKEQLIDLYMPFILSKLKRPVDFMVNQHIYKLPNAKVPLFYKISQ